MIEVFQTLSSQSRHQGLIPFCFQLGSLCQMHVLEDQEKHVCAVLPGALHPAGFHRYAPDAAVYTHTQLALMPCKRRQKAGILPMRMDRLRYNTYSLYIRMGDR